MDKLEVLIGDLDKSYEALSELQAEGLASGGFGVECLGKSIKRAK